MAILQAMKHASVFKSNRNQAVRIPKDFAFAEGVSKVVIRKVGKSVILTPVNAFWDEFFDKPGIDINEPEDNGPLEVRESF